MLYRREMDYRQHLINLAQWLGEQPPDETYSYLDSTNCLIARWLKARGEEQYDLLTGEIKRKYGFQVHDVAIAYPNTYGSALRRVLELLKQ